MFFKKKKDDTKDDEFANMIIESREHLYKCAYYYLGNRDESIEAVQEATYRAYKNRKQFSGDKDRFKAWITRIVVNYCNDQFKKKHKVIFMEDVQKLISIDRVDNFDYIRDNYSTFELVQKLKPIYREVIILRFVRDFKIKDIAEILDRPESTVKSQIKKALMLMKDSIEKEERSYENWS